MLDANRIVGNLWIGSAPPTGRAVAAAGFDLLVLCADNYQPAQSEFDELAEVHHAPFADDATGLGRKQLAIAFAAAELTAVRLAQGKRCLVTCLAGRNRSGLVCALAMAEATGVSPVRAGEIVRERRQWSLTNPAFRTLLAKTRSA